MSDIVNDFFFDGSSGLTSGQFVRVVRQNALDKDKATDDQWIAFYATAHMDGPALEWLEDQSEEMQESWRLLRRALLVRWAPSAPIGGDMRIPTPAVAAAPPSNTNVIAPATVPPTPGTPLTLPKPRSSVRIGKIRVLSLLGDHLGYLSKNLDSEGDCVVTARASDAQIVQVTISDKHSTIYCNRGGEARFDFGPQLGLTQRASEPPKNMFGILALLTSKASPGFQSTSTDFKGISFEIKWCITLDGTMIPSLEESPALRHDLEIAVGKPGAYINLMYNVEEHQKKTPTWTAEQVLFIFEPIQ